MAAPSETPPQVMLPRGLLAALQDLKARYQSDMATIAPARERAGHEEDRDYYSLLLGAEYRINSCKDRRLVHILHLAPIYVPQHTPSLAPNVFEPQDEQAVPVRFIRADLVRSEGVDASISRTPLVDYLRYASITEPKLDVDVNSRDQDLLLQTHIFPVTASSFFDVPLPLERRRVFPDRIVWRPKSLGGPRLFYDPAVLRGEKMPHLPPYQPRANDPRFVALPADPLQPLAPRPAMLVADRIRREVLGAAAQQIELYSEADVHRLVAENAMEARKTHILNKIMRAWVECVADEVSVLLSTDYVYLPTADDPSKRVYASCRVVNAELANAKQLVDEAVQISAGVNIPVPLEPKLTLDVLTYGGPGVGWKVTPGLVVTHDCWFLPAGQWTEDKWTVPPQIAYLAPV